MYRSGRIIECTSPNWARFNHDPGHNLHLDANLHSPQRRLIELQIEHADLDAVIDRTVALAPVDELMVRRLKKRRLALRDEIARLKDALEPNEPA